jgi:hypothetical protein
LKHVEEGIKLVNHAQCGRRDPLRCLSLHRDYSPLRRLQGFYQAAIPSSFVLFNAARSRLGTLFSEKYLAKWPHRIPSPPGQAGPKRNHAATEDLAIFSPNHDATPLLWGRFCGRHFSEDVHQIGSSPGP